MRRRHGRRRGLIVGLVVAVAGLVALGVARAAGDEPVCASGTEMSGAPPPQGLRVVCSHPDGRRDVTEWWPRGGRHSTGSLVDDRREGIWTFWYQWGQKKQQGLFRAGEREGVWQRWHANGQLAVRATYVAGRLDGPWSLFYPDGALHRSGQFADDLKLGTWIEWLPGRKGGIVTKYVSGRRVSRREFSGDTGP